MFSVHLHVLPAIGTGDFSHPVDYPGTSSCRRSRSGCLDRLFRTARARQHARGARTRTTSARRTRSASASARSSTGMPSRTRSSRRSPCSASGSAPSWARDLRRGDLRPAGLGTLIYDSIESRNYPVVRGGVLVVADPVRALQPARRPLLPLPRPAHPRGAGPADGRPASRSRRLRIQRARRAPASRATRGRRAGPRAAFGLVVVATCSSSALIPGRARTLRPGRAGHPVRLQGPSSRPPPRHGRARPRPPLAGHLRRPHRAGRRVPAVLFALVAGLVLGVARRVRGRLARQRARSS